jgi:DNA-binding NarL/FixJ family response regulator
MRKIKVVVCDDHQVVLEGLRLILEKTDAIEVADVFQDPKALVSFLNQAPTPPDVVIIDAHLGNNENGLDIRNQVPNAKLYKWVLFSSYVDKYLAFQAEKFGFYACLSKEVPARVLTSVLLNTNHDQFVCYPEIPSDEKLKRRMEIVYESIQSLTKRESEVLQVLLSGVSSKECANRMHISVYTFETHKKNIFRKLEINSSNELMRIAIDFNIK